ncbi:MAG: hypothetical protein ACRDTU_05495 [Micromonosporaceae bacterium]
MSSQASTTQTETAAGRTGVASTTLGSTGTPTGYGAAPTPQLISRVPQVSTGNRPPTWGQLQTPPQGAAFARPAPPAQAPEHGADVPLFRGALGARSAPMRMRHLIALCTWAASVTLLGLGVGLWAMIRLMSFDTPGWYEPVIVVTGLTGIVLAIAAFVTSDRRYLPWGLMAASTAVLFITIGITSATG